MIRPGVTPDEVASVWPDAQEFGYRDEAEAFLLQYGHGVGLSLWERPIFSKRFRGQNKPLEGGHGVRARNLEGRGGRLRRRAHRGGGRRHQGRLRDHHQLPLRPADLLRPAGLRSVLNGERDVAEPPTEPKRRIPVTLVTGFLGSGKTTLINAALRAPELARTLVVVNEFGEVGLDHKLFARSSDAVVVLENGCLCCTVRSDLVGTLNSLYHARQAGEIPAFDNVVIETSGLAEPGPVLQAFLSEPTLDGLYRVASVLTLVDAVNWEGTAREHDESVRQVALADQIRIGKLDLVAGDRDAAEARSARGAAAPQPRRRDRRRGLGVRSGRQVADLAGLRRRRSEGGPAPLAEGRKRMAREPHVHDDACGHEHHVPLRSSARARRSRASC